MSGSMEGLSRASANARAVFASMPTLITPQLAEIIDSTRRIAPLVAEMAKHDPRLTDALARAFRRSVH